jgi:hypothetical protein
MLVPDDIVKSVSSGQCILFLGAMASAPSPTGCCYAYKSENALPNGTQLAESLALKCNYPEKDNTNLQRVSLYYQFNGTPSRNRLVRDIVAEIAKPEIVPSPALHMLAGLPFRFIITTNYDHLFDLALRQAKTIDGQAKDPIVKIYDPDLQRVPEMVPLDPSERRPVLLKLHGDIDRPESIVVTEEDYLVFIHKMSDQHHHPIHDNLRCRINNWPVLFIGYSLKDYNLRLLFRTLRWHVDGANFPLSFSVDPTPDDLIVSVWQRGDKPMVSFVRENLWDFVPALYKACLNREYTP